MRSIKKIWLGIGALVGLLAAGQVAAQVAEDFPNLKGSNARTGRNGDPNGSNPGPANLRWYATNAAASNGTRLVVDNTDTTPPYIHPTYGPYQTNNFGFTASTAGWNIGTNPNAADDSFLVQVRARPEGGNVRNASPRPQYYLYTDSTASQLGGPQTAPDNPGSLQTFTWNFTPPTNQPGQYALYVYLPVQPTVVGLGLKFPQRYYVYQITFAGNTTRTEIVDSYASGGGWVRLGASGQPTAAVFGYDGTNPIRIQLYNTVPRNDQGRLMLPNGITNPNEVMAYADAAMAIPQPGSYAATPTSARRTDGDINSTTVTGASNEKETGLDVETGDATSSTNSVVTNYDYQNGNARWRFIPAAETGSAITQDDDQAVQSGAGAWVEDDSVGFPKAVGNGARVAPVTLDATPGVPSEETYTFNVPGSGSYAVYAYIPPLVTGRPLAHGARYVVETTRSDGTLALNIVTVDQSANEGWVRIGTRYSHDTYQNNETDPARPIRVRISNFSADNTDGARWVYADGIRVVGETSLAVTSSPVHANALVRVVRGADPVERKVVFVADESGRIHCLDAEGNNDGTTREYWCYPSVRDSNNYDPNHGPITPGGATVVGEDWSGPGNTAAIDRSSLADMPSGFELSTAVVQRFNVGGVDRDFLYIASSNGRIYCIDVAGRGDNDGSVDLQSGGTRTIGTTTRLWTYPNTYPSPNPVTTSNLGPFRGSLVVQNGVVYAPSTQGRIYALNALGNANKTTNVNWAFPALDQPTLGAINGTPSFEFGRLYFGTMRKISATEDIPGRIYALNPDGTQAWAAPFQRTGDVGTAIDVRRTDDFRSSLITVPGAQLGGTDPNSVFALNENRVLYALDADTGALRWANDELQTGATGSLGFTQMLAYNNAGILGGLSPVILVPGTNGQFSALFANTTNLNVFNGRLAWGFTAAGDSIDASMSVSNGWMYGADTRGYLYAWSTGTGISLPIGDGGSPLIPPNNPLGNLMRKSKIRLINRDMYRRLRQPEDSAGRASYAQATAGLTATDETVFEWGQTAYVLVYDFPYQIEDPDGNPVDPPIANISFTADGRTVRGVSVQSRRFDNGDAATDGTVPLFEDVAPLGPMPGVTDNPRMNGYAVLAFPLQNGGANAVPPGAGEISFNLQTAGLTTGGALQTVALSPNIGPRLDNQAWSRMPFRVANPLAIVVPNEGGFLPSPATPDRYQLGMVADPTAAAGSLKQEALMNGSLDVGGGKLQSKMTTATPVTNHGGTGKAKIWIYDRSFMALLRPGGVFGLDNVRLDRRNLGRQGGERAVYKRFDPTYYVGFEDLPVETPNRSADYPDIFSEQIRVIKEPNGSAENPIFSGVALRAPRGPGNIPLTEDVAPGSRIFVPTEFEINVEVPRYQPPINLDLLRGVPSAIVPGSNPSATAAYPQGHIGRLQVFVDSLSNGQLDMAQREAYRSFNLATSVAIDERLRITTPTVDLGSLPAGTGYSPRELRPGYLSGMVPSFDPASPLANSRDFMHPWNGSAFEGAFKKFGVVNEGNVNLLNLRAATASNINLPTTLPLSIDPTGNDPLSWLNGLFNIHTDLDYRYSPGPNGANRPVALQKARVTDRLPTSLSANAQRRQNSNLGTVDSLLNTVADPVGTGGLRFPKRSPMVGVSVPIGFPVGKYATRLVIFEDSLNQPGDDYGTIPLTTGGGTPPVYPSTPIWQIRRRQPFNGVTGVIPGGAPEPATEPGILLSFNVVESRLTNSYTPKTAPMVDNLAPTGGDLSLRYQNAQPTATRDSNGSLIVAWASNRTAFGNTPAADGSDFSRGATRLFFASLDNGGTFSGASYNVPSEPAASGSKLRDLGLWTPAATTQWFRQAVGNYPPAAASAYFGGTMLDASVRYDSPAFPSGGYRNPFTGAAFSNAKMAFVGRGTRSTPSGLLDESRLFLAGVTSNATGQIAVPDPISTGNDPQVTKSEPSVLQTSNTGAIVTYTGVSAGQAWGYYTRFEGTGFGPTSALPFGRGFLTTGGVSATGRLYTGARATGAPASRPIAEVVFTGQLRGRPYPETFIARATIAANPDGSPIVPMRFAENTDGTLTDTVFEFLPAVQDEVVERESASLFRTRGVAWRRDADIALFQRVNNVVTPVLVPNTRTADRETGLISYESRLGGRVTFDPAQGTVRFGTAAPTGSAQLFITYTPRFLRLSDASNQGGGAAKATSMYDQRFISDVAYWRRGNGAFVTNEAITNDRLVLMWNRAAGSGATARPFLSSLRFGIDLTYRLPTLPDGTPGYRDGSGNVQPAVRSVTAVGFGPVDAYQIDPSSGRIYLPQAYEGYEIDVRFVAVDDNGNLIMDGPNDPHEFPRIQTARYVTERGQEPVPIETAVNESGLSAFLDPFSYVNDRRPPLVWLFWTSTRGGVPDIYFQTIAPMWTPTAIAK